MQFRNIHSKFFKFFAVCAIGLSIGGYGCANGAIPNEAEEERAPLLDKDSVPEEEGVPEENSSESENSNTSSHTESTSETNENSEEDEQEELEPYDADGIMAEDLEGGVTVQGSESHNTPVSGGGTQEVILTQEEQQMVDEAYVEPTPVVPETQVQETINNEVDALENSAPALPVDFQVSAPGKAVDGNERATVDYSNAGDGYVMVYYSNATGNRLKALVDGPTGVQYQYNINPQEWTSLPLSDGNGTYKIGIFENVRGNSYATVINSEIPVTLKDEYAPFLRSNQYVNISAAPQTINLAQQVCGAHPAALKKVQLVYDWVVNNIHYDYNKAASVQSGYLPNLDAVLASKTGICFDYAALMTGMLRSQGVPCKLVVGYAGQAYHAWIDVWSQDQGWISGAVFFDGNAWQRLDPTFASSGGQSDEIMQYIGDGHNYSAKYFY